MKYTFVGTHSESLASGRPLVFGDQVDAKELDKEADARLLATLLTPEASVPVTPNSEAK